MIKNAFKYLQLQIQILTSSLQLCFIKERKETGYQDGRKKRSKHVLSAGL